MREEPGLAPNFFAKRARGPVAPSGKRGERGVWFDGSVLCSVLRHISNNYPIVSSSWAFWFSLERGLSIPGWKDKGEAVGEDETREQITPPHKTCLVTEQLIFTFQLLSFLPSCIWERFACPQGAARKWGGPWPLARALCPECIRSLPRAPGA